MVLVIIGVIVFAALIVRAKRKEDHRRQVGVVSSRGAVRPEHLATYGVAPKQRRRFTWPW